jgi:hypothetical protein
MKSFPSFASIRSFIVKVLPWVVYFCLSVVMLFGPIRDTIGVPSAAFVVTLALASVTFSYARTLKEGSGLRDELIFGGERLLSAAILFLLASLFKYASYDIPWYVDRLFQAFGLPDQPGLSTSFFGYNPLTVLLGFGALMFFFLALLYLQLGIVIVVSIAGHRAKKRPDHDKFFVASESYNKRLEELEKEDAKKLQLNEQKPLAPPQQETGG